MAFRGFFMYTISSEQSFDSAHFLSGYDGKCSNIHGHRWRVKAFVCSDFLMSEGQLRGMVADFGDLKGDLKKLADDFDHTLIYEEGTLKESTVRALKDENFSLTPVNFRPTAENFAKYFYDILSDKGYKMYSVSVYETPNNCASYSGDR